MRERLLVLGGRSELGLAIARALVAEGTRTVVLAGRGQQPVPLPGAEVHAVDFDADVPETHEAALDAAWAAAGGGIDAVMVAFGALGAAWPGVEDPDASVALLRTNALGGSSAVLRAARRLRDQGHGDLILLSSAAVARARPASFVYAAGKLTADVVARGAADALRGTGARVLVVRPGFVPTAMTAGMRPPPLSTTPDEVARATVEGLRRGAEVVHVPHALRVVGLLARVLPGAVIRRLPR
jgi:decaprenylphospho-beta-D-erythro-pentofuranosid-2-ulose 2-reductase